MKYLDPLSLAKLKNLSLRLGRLAAQSPAAGRHKSAWKGFSRDFAQHRAYTPGDEIKSLDWKLYARADRFYVKEFTAESVLSGHLLLDSSGSMSFRSGGAEETKWDYACRLAMAVSYLILAEGDAVGLSVFDTEPRRFLQPQGSFSHLERLDAALQETRPAGETDLDRALTQAAARLKGRSLILLLSDLMGPPEAVLRVMKALKTRGHEIMILQVLDPAERDFDFQGPTVFESLEDNSRFFCEASLVRSAYQEQFSRWLGFYQAGFSKNGIAHAALYTDIPWDASLGRFLSAAGSANR